MWIQNFFKSLTWTPTRRRPIRRRPPASRLRLEQLEDRMLPSSFTAATVSDLIADIDIANQQGGSNTITLVAPTGSTYTPTAVDNTTDGATGLPVIAPNDNLTIIGSGDIIQRSTWAGTPAFRLFDVASGAALTLENLTLQGGWAYGSGVSASGGSIYSQGSLTLDGVTVQGNTAVGSDGISGGGIYTGNAGAGSDGRGGGLYVAGGTVTITNSNLSANQALGGNGGNGYGVGPVGLNGGNGGNGLGGAVYVAAGTVIMTSDTWSANTAQGGRGGNGGSGITDGEYTIDSYGGAGGYGGTGGGAAVSVAAGTVVMTNDTLSANTAQGGRGGDGGWGYDSYGFPPYYGGHGGNAGSGASGVGGGVDVAGGTVTLTSTTVSSNSALAGTGGIGGFGDVTAGRNGNLGLGEGGGVYSAFSAVVRGTGKLAGGIDGAGTLVIGDGGDLTANHVVQGALVIGGSPGHPATLTIAASDAAGNPLAVGQALQAGGATSSAALTESSAAASVMPDDEISGQSTVKNASLVVGSLSPESRTYAKPSAAIAATVEALRSNVLERLIPAGPAATAPSNADLRFSVARFAPAIDESLIDILALDRPRPRRGRQVEPADSAPDHLIV